MNNNFLQVGETCHCLKCHLPVARVDLLNHSELCVGKAVMCDVACYGKDTIQGYHNSANQLNAE